MTERKAFFVGGSGRSGTTILFKSLASHPQLYCSVGREIQFFGAFPGSLGDLVSPYIYGPAYEFREKLMSSLGLVEHQLFYSRVGRNLVARRTKGVVRKNLHHLFGGLIDGKVARDERAVWDHLGRYLFAIFADGGDRVWVEKTPWNCLWFDKLRLAFPGCQCIFIYRDPRDVVDSMSEQPWVRGGFDGALAYYARWLLSWERTKSRIGHENSWYHEVQYERLMAMPSEWPRLLERCSLSPMKRPDFALRHPRRFDSWSNAQRASMDKLLRSSAEARRFLYFPWKGCS